MKNRAEKVIIGGEIRQWDGSLDLLDPTIVSADWQGIVAEHGQMVVQAAMRILGNAADAEEVAQEVSSQVVSQFPPGGVRNWGSYLRKLAVYRSLERQRQRRVESPLPDAGLPSAELSPLDDIVRRELAEHLRSLIGSLPQREGVVFALRYCERLSKAEIADVLQISPGAIAAALHKVRTKLQTFVYQV